jgi:hypothetical protein
MRVLGVRAETRDFITAIRFPWETSLRVATHLCRRWCGGEILAGPFLCTKRNRPPSTEAFNLESFESSSFRNFAGLQAGGAHADALVRAFYLGVNRTQVHVPAATTHVVRVAYLVAEARAFAADITYLCHFRDSRLRCLGRTMKASERCKTKSYRNISCWRKLWKRHDTWFKGFCALIATLSLIRCREGCAA